LSNRTLPPPGPELTRAFSRAPWDGRLRLSWTDDSGARSVILDRTAVLGSSENVDVLVRNPIVSRVHAELELWPDGAWVRDLGSSNRTFVDRVEVKCARIEAGHTLRLGSVEIVVDVADKRGVYGHDVWPEPRFGPLIGQSLAMRELFATLARVADTDIPVFIRGETGSGKELVARAIHEASRRAKKPYVVVDCAALTQSLLESELFGHARGAFTGATGTRQGAIEAANGGTVFLDEIGELPLEMQPKLLRVLEQRTVRRVGESEHRPVDVRFVAATHRDLVDYVARGWFREDLYFRLAVLPVRLPPLRERMEDLELLVRHFVGEDAQSIVTPALLSALQLCPWRGNVRELRNAIDRVRTLGVERALAPEEDTRARIGDESEALSSRPRTNSDVEAVTGVRVPTSLLRLSHRDFRDRWAELGERAYLEQKLVEHGRNVSRVSRDIALARTYMHKLIKKHGL
jgi:transcriptional regulator with GAF, ATPase, and Fis domain